MTVSKWDQRFLSLADHISHWSKDPSTKVGAVIVRPDKTIASLGFNGFPRAINDTTERLENRDLKYAFILHAEVNALLNSQTPVQGHTMYLTHPCCERCAVQVIQAGIKRVVAIAPHGAFADRWTKNVEMSAMMFAEADVAVELIDFLDVFPEFLPC